MMVDFHIADYSIPLGLLNWWIAHSFGLSETALRTPMLVSGIALVALLPIAVLRRAGLATAVVFAFLLALSPILITYSQMARPYALTLLLVFATYALFIRYMKGSLAAGIACSLLGALCVWLHLVSASFVAAPYLWCLATLPSVARERRPEVVLRLFRIGLLTVVCTSLVILPPLHARLGAITEKSGLDTPGASTMIGAFYWWLGTPSSLVVMACLLVSMAGVRRVFTAFPEARFATLGVALTLGAVFVARPHFVQNVPTLGRYLLPAVPLLLLLLAVGSVRLAEFGLRRISGSRGMVAAVALAPALALAVTSALPAMLRRPNSYQLTAEAYFDPRHGNNPIGARLSQIPLSNFWTTLSERPRGSITVAAAPFYFETFDWDGRRWEAVSGQRVIPGYLTEFCVQQRWGETPRKVEFRFENAVHLADGERLKHAGVDYVVWQKPYVQYSSGTAEPIGLSTRHCEEMLRRSFGLAVYEDDALVAFSLRHNSASR